MYLTSLQRDKQELEKERERWCKTVEQVRCLADEKSALQRKLESLGSLSDTRRVGDLSTSMK